eukprot:scaffold15551_cov62-Phaeocystis_antarctica.AAC.12
MAVSHRCTATRSCRKPRTVELGVFVGLNGAAGDGVDVKRELILLRHEVDLGRCGSVGVGGAQVAVLWRRVGDGHRVTHRLVHLVQEVAGGCSLGGGQPGCRHRFHEMRRGGPHAGGVLRPVDFGHRKVVRDCVLERLDALVRVRVRVGVRVRGSG